MLRDMPLTTFAFSRRKSGEKGCPPPLIKRKTTIAITEKQYEKRRLQSMSPSRRTAFITQTTVSTDPVRISHAACQQNRRSALSLHAMPRARPHTKAAHGCRQWPRRNHDQASTPRALPSTHAHRTSTRQDRCRKCCQQKVGILLNAFTTLLFRFCIYLSTVH